MERLRKTLLPKIVTILGPTGSGKSALALHLSKIFNGEVVIADSRQVYKYFSIGTNKDKGVWKKVDGVNRYVVDGVIHHLIDYVDPKKTHSLYNFQTDAKIAIEDIISRGKLPIVSGGTGMYLRSLTDNWEITEAKASGELRKYLESKSNIELINEIKSISSKKIKELDIFNKRRLARVLEVFYQTGELLSKKPKSAKPEYSFLKLGVYIEREKLFEKINSRVDLMMGEGLLEEVKMLSKKYDDKIPVFSSIGYRELRAHIKGETSLDEAVELMKRSTRRYARKQLTWWRREHDIKLINSTDEAVNQVTSFLK